MTTANAKTTGPKFVPAKRCVAFAINGHFLSVNRRKRSHAVTHDWADEATAAITKNPTDVVEWLKLAERLEEDGNPAHHMIRVLFEDRDPPVNFRGYIFRGGTYHESGERREDGVSITWRPARSDEDGNNEPAGFVMNAGEDYEFRITTVEAVIALTAPKSAKCGWGDLDIQGTVDPVGRQVPAGTPVKVWKDGCGRDTAKNHTTTEAIPVPLTLAPHWLVLDSEHKYHNSKNCFRFLYRGFWVEVGTSKVETW